MGKSFRLLSSCFSTSEKCGPAGGQDVCPVCKEISSNKLADKLNVTDIPSKLSNQSEKAKFRSWLLLFAKKRIGCVLVVVIR